MTRLIRSLRATERESMTQGRLVATQRPATTGPATPNAAAVTLGLGRTLPRNRRHDRLERRELAALEDLVPDPAPARREQREARACSADVPDDDHLATRCNTSPRAVHAVRTSPSPRAAR